MNENFKFLPSHEWVKLEEDGTVTVGISDHAQDQLGDIVFVELPDIGQQIDKSSEAAIVESVKAASDIFSPVSGEVIEVNEKLLENPEIVNSSPFENGWFYKLRPSDELDMSHLMTIEEYIETNK